MSMTKAELEARVAELEERLAEYEANTISFADGRTVHISGSGQVETDPRRDIAEVAREEAT